MGFVLRISLLAALLICCCSFGACPPRPTAECRAFYELNYKQQQERVRSVPIEQQIVLYKCGLYQEPPDDFAAEIAEGGEKIVPYLLERLKAEQSETFRDSGFLHLFEELAKRGYLRNRRDVVEQLRLAVSSFNNNEIKRSAQQKVDLIESNL